MQMDDILFLMIITLCTVFVYKSVSRRSPSVNHPPSPKSLPIIGHIHLLTNMPHHSLFKLAQKYGPIMYLRLGQVPTVVISSAREVLKTHDHVFCNRPQLIAAQYLSFGCSDIAFSNGAHWRQIRKICVNELLSPRKISSFQLIRGEETDRLLSSLSAQSGSETDMGQLFFNLANDVLCRVAFGKRYLSETNKSAGQKGKNLVDVLTESQELFAGFCAGDFFLEWGWVNLMTGFKKRLERNLKDLRSVCDEIIEEHLMKQGEGTGADDFVGALLRVQKQDNVEFPVTDDNIKALILEMFEGGTDTTSATLEWTMTELARHPEMMKKAQEEVRSISSDEGCISEKHLQHLHFLKMVIKETLRLHPPVPLLLPRESTESCLIDGYEIQAKTLVIINAFAIGRDSGSWNEPLCYNPERLAEGNLKMSESKGHDFRFLPFGGGRRGCPGYSFGLATAELTLARLLYHFDWEVPPGIEAEKMDLTEIFGLATRKKTPLVLIPTISKAHPLKK